MTCRPSRCACAKPLSRHCKNFDVRATLRDECGGGFSPALLCDAGGSPGGDGVDAGSSEAWRICLAARRQRQDHGVGEFTLGALVLAHLLRRGGAKSVEAYADAFCIREIARCL